MTSPVKTPHPCDTTTQLRSLTDGNVGDRDERAAGAGDDHGGRAAREVLHERGALRADAVAGTVEGGPRTVGRWLVPNFDHGCCWMMSSFCGACAAYLLLASGFLYRRRRVLFKASYLFRTWT